MDVVDKIIELTELFDDNVVTTADKIDRPQQALDKEAFDDFNKRNPMAGGGMLVQPGFGGVRQGYSGRAEKLLTSNQQQKIKDAFPNIKFDFTEDQKFGVQKYLESKKPGPDTRKVNKDYTKVARFIKKGFKKEMGEGKTTRGTTYQKEGKRLSIKDQNKIKAKFDLPEGVKEWDFVNNKYGIKQGEKYKNLVKRMAQTVADKNPWTLAADFGSTKGWMLAQMERVYKNEIKNNPTGKLTYEPKYEKINGVKRIIGFKDNTKAGGGKTYYGLNKYTKKKAGDWTKHGDWKLNQKLVDISKRSFNQPNEVITGLLKEKGFTDKIRLNDLINYLAGTEATSAENLKNAIVKHHNSGVAFGSATNDLSLTTQTINKKIVEAEKRIRANNILPEDVQLLKNNNIYVRSGDGKLYGAGSKTPIGQFKQIEKAVEEAVRSPNFNVKGLVPFMKELGIKCRLSTGINCMNPKAYEKSLNELIVKSNAGDAAAKAKMLKFGNKVSTAGRLIKGALGPIAIASEIALDVGLSLYDTMDKGVPVKQAFADSLTNKYILGPELQVDKQEEIKKELLEREMPDGTKIMLEDTPFNRQRGLEFAMAKRGERKGKTIFGVPLMAQSKEADKQRLKERQKQMDALYADELASKDLSNEEIDAFLAGEGVYSPYTLGLGMQQKKPGEGEMRYNEDVAYDELRDLFNKSVQDAIISKQFKNIADAGGVANLAGGGIAKLAGVDSGPPPEAGPNSRGLSSLMKRGTNT
tara:strand:+ start:2007 stop:4256 length:2250 start_codon:yes stop_codon:yes gene_type:complete